jgi:hypothetical protein
MKQLQVYGWSWNKFIGYRTKRYLNFAQLSHHNFQCKNPKLTLKGDQAFLIIKPTRCTNYSNLFLEWNSTCFGQFLCPSSGVFHCTHNYGICHTDLLTACEQEHILLFASCLQNSMTYTIAVCTVKNSWWWTEELTETCRVSLQK